MRFAHPWFLLLLLLLPLLAWLKGKLGGRSAFLYSSVALLRGIMGVNRSHVGAILMRLRWAALALFIIGLARPQLGLGVVPFKSSGIDIMVVLDLSTSMKSEDFELDGQRVNRLVVAKEVLRAFIEKRPNDRIGLLAFARWAYLVAPPTLDHGFLLDHIDRLNIGAVQDGTAIGSALAAALGHVDELRSESRIVILMTDGQSNAGKVPPSTAAEAASALGVKVYTIGIGTRGFAPQPFVDPLGVRRYRQVEVDIDEEALRHIATATGGAYYRADSSSTLREIYDGIDRLEKTEFEVNKYRRHLELFPWAVIPGFVLLMLEIILSNTVWRTLP